MSLPKTVAIIGAGPGGLAAAKALLHNHAPGTFMPTIFEKLSRVGGLWPAQIDDYSGIVHPDMPTNASKHIVSFSDLAWDSLIPELGSRTPMFPKAHQVGKYLHKYAEKYIPNRHIKLNCEVVRALRQQSEANGRWKIEWRKTSLDGNQEGSDTNQDCLGSAIFDYLIIASGFFAKPWMTEVPGLNNFDGRVIHSSQLKDIDTLVGVNSNRTHDDANQKGGKILVIGGSFSGGEAASMLAFQLSSGIHSPQSSISNLSRYTVHHVVPRSAWLVPPYTPTNPRIDSNSDSKPETGAELATKLFNPRPYFLPFDLVLADITKKPKDRLTFRPSSTFAPEAAKFFSEFIMDTIGTNQIRLGDGAHGMTPSDYTKPPWIILCNSYAEFVRSGEIRVTVGHVDRMDASTVSVTSPDSKHTTLDNVIAIVMATGFSPEPAVSFLDESTLQSLQFQPNNHYTPLNLYNYSTTTPEIPNLGFVGFYRGAYWGVIEQQARFLGALWSNSLPTIPSIPPASVSESQRGQFPMGDYAGLMESFSQILGIQRLPMSASIGQEAGPVIPARFHYRSIQTQERDENSDDKEGEKPEITRALTSLVDTLDNMVWFTAPAVFRALQGRWSLHREIKSYVSYSPSGTFTGEACMYPRAPTAAGFSAEYLYSENGKLTMNNGMSIDGYKSYVYRLSEEEPQKMSCWFVKPGLGNKEVDYIFHSVEFESEGNNDGNKIEEDRSKLQRTTEEKWGIGWRAKGEHHLCEADHYDTDYWFRFRGIEIPEWGISYVVKGPKKDYTTKATYVRQ